MVLLNVILFCSNVIKLKIWKLSRLHVYNIIILPGLERLALFLCNSIESTKFGANLDYAISCCVVIFEHPERVLHRISCSHMWDIQTRDDNEKKMIIQSASRGHCMVNGLLMAKFNIIWDEINPNYVQYCSPTVKLFGAVYRRERINISFHHA